MRRFLHEVTSPYQLMSPSGWFLVFMTASFDAQWPITRWLFLAVTVLLAVDRLLGVHEERD